MSKVLFAYAIIMVIFSISIVGCSESGGSSAIEPLSDEPMILESVMCIGVSSKRPDGITNTFLSTDDKIYIWIYWTNVEDASTVEAVWYDPGGRRPYLEDSQTIHSRSGFAVTWFYINKPPGGFKSGEWAVNIYLDGAFERSHLFMVE